MPRPILRLASLLASCLGLASARGAEVRLDATRDLWVSTVDREADGNNGGASRLKVKSYQEMSLFDVDPTALRGKTIRSATLHVRRADGPPLRRMTVASVSAPWVEGTGTNYQPQAGSSTFRRRIHPGTPWTLDGGDLGRVTLGVGSSRWRMADATPPDAEGRQTIPVDPGIVALRAAGLSDGFLLFDDTGTEWTRNGEKFTVLHMPNRFVYSREQNRASAPHLMVEFGPEDRQPPAAVATIEQEEAPELPAGEAIVAWTTPRDAGPAGVVGFFVTAGVKEVPRDLVPLAGAPGSRVRLHLRDLGLLPGQAVTLAVRSVDAAGNVGPVTRGDVRLSSRVAKPLPGQRVAIPAPAAGGPSVSLGEAKVAIVDELDKVHPETGRLIPEQAAGYLDRNHLWDAASRKVTLHAARNEFVAFQVVVKGAPRDVRPSLTLAGPLADGATVRLGRYRDVATKAGPLPDPIVVLGGPEDRGRSDKATYQSFHVELYVPHQIPAGAHAGTLTLRAGGASVDVGVELTVWDFTLPDVLSFLPEMNCYGLPPAERDYYRLAHLHRTALNRVPYSQAGEVAEGCAPAWDATRKTFDWRGYDARFGPLLDGSAFADLPRKGVPLEIFYLPLHENWPTPIEPNYNGGYWADRAFTPAYRAAFVEASRQFARHCDEKKWDETLFQCFFNGKWNFKEKGWSRGSSPWLLDEPANFQDFWALRYFGAAFHEGVHQARRGRPGTARMLFRADISRPEWQRDALDGLLDYNVVSSALRAHHRLVIDRKAREGQVVLEYGSANPVEESNVQAVGWSLDAWSLGADGVLPWQTMGRGDSWREADTLSLFYPPLNGKEPVPSIRLKAFRRGQQDVEYLTLLAQTTGEPRAAVGTRVREALRLAGERGSSGFTGGEDAGLIRFRSLRPQDAWALRVRVGAALSQAHPGPKRALIELRTPPRDPSGLEPREVGVKVGG